MAVSGQTPAIVTETLWALENQRSTRVDEIRVITTSSGRNIIQQKLLGERGEFSRFVEDYGIAAGRIAFSENNIYVIRDAAGAELDDIRTGQDNLYAADQVFNLIREWCSRKGERLFCSAAGGRKTLGIYLTMALMMCGRPVDRLYHVLVTPQFETSVPDFFYPPPGNRLYRIVARGQTENANADSMTISSEDALIELAEIPFLRLSLIAPKISSIEKGFTESVVEMQRIMDYIQNPPWLLLHLDSCRIEIGDFEFSLPRQLAAVYAFFLLEFNGPEAADDLSQMFKKRHLIAQLERQIDRYKRAEMEVYAWEKMKDLDDFLERISPCISKINRAIRRAVTNDLVASHYAIRTGGRKYQLNVRQYKVLGSGGKKWKWSG
ncbi:MAG: CRISPR-associated ring nuclease Csm6 [Desulfobacteraceae bacterium]|nr:CRISPR-associated ring nuclease Csm6 [Desulfobacteraceae bacterium]